MLKHILIFCFLTICVPGAAQQQAVIDSISKLRTEAQNSELSPEIRLNAIQRAYDLSKEVGRDSLILSNGRYLSYLKIQIDDYDNLPEINHKNIALSEKLGDSTLMAYSYHDLAWYYDIHFNIDSAYYYYYNAQKLYDKLNDKRNGVYVLINLAILQKNQGDYIGAEQKAIQGIKLANELSSNADVLESLWSLNNMLGSIAIEQKQYDVALEYHERTLDITKKMNRSFSYLRLSSLNNIANTYNKLGRYDEALKLFEIITSEEDILEIDPDIYVLALGNLARTKFLLGNADHDEIITLFERAIAVGDSINDAEGKVSALTYMTDYYMSVNDTDAAYNTAKRTYDLSKEIEDNRLVLKSLKQMAELSDGLASKNYLNEYIKLSDSLVDNEREYRNKFARIEFETDQLKAEKEKVTRERQIFLIFSIALLVTLLLLYVIITQRAKNKELKFVQAQQEANEEIYNLMLAQQDKIDEGRTAEKKRISEELHDGVLGRLFGTRLSLDSLNFVNTDEAIKTRGQYIEELKSIEQEIRKISHDLNTDFVTGRSFSDILRSLVDSQMQAYGIQYVYKEDDDIDWDSFSNKTKIHIYRMLQETMQNTYKHAEAKHVKIGFEQKNGVILLTVEDDGKGFNTNKARKGIGLKNFDSRANDIGGKVEIFSNPGKGTKVRIHIPRV